MYNIYITCKGGIDILLLYHGTIDRYADDIAQNGILLCKSKPHLDFGAGFYTTPDKEFAITTAKRRMKRYNAFCKSAKKQVNWRVLKFECNEVLFQNLQNRQFEKADASWAQFILANRCSNPIIHASYDNNIDHKYDTVWGPTADGANGAITLIVESLNGNRMDLIQADYTSFAPSVNSSWGQQCSFHTEVSLACIRLVDML